MLKKFTTSQLVFIALWGALLAVVNSVVGMAITSAVGVPLASRIFTGITIGLSIVVIVKIIPKLGSMTLLMMIYSIIGFPAGAAGLPGFWPSIPITIVSVFVGDLFAYVVRYKTGGIFLAWYIGVPLNIAGFLLALKALGMSQLGVLLPVAHIVLLVNLLCGTLGIFLGLWVYKKMKDKRIIRQMGG
jgi:hypothetical protein